MMKPGAKRRRRQVRIKGQDSEAEVARINQQEQRQKIMDLELALKRERESHTSGRAASQILTNLINEGHVEQLEDGSVRAKDNKDFSPNIIGNAKDQMD